MGEKSIQIRYQTLCPCSPHIVVIEPHRSPLLLFLCPYIVIAMSARIIMWSIELLYIEMRFFHLNRLRIVHLCNVKEVSPSKWMTSKDLISLFFYFLSWFHNIWYPSFGFYDFSASNRASWNFLYKFVSTKFQKLNKRLICE